MITNRRSAAFLGKVTLAGLLVAAGCSSGGGGGSGKGGGGGAAAGASGTAGAGAGGSGGTSAGGTTGTGGDATGGTGGSSAGSGGTAGTGAGGTGGSGTGGTAGAAGAGGGPGTGGRGGSAGGAGGGGGAAAGAGGRGGGGGAAGTGGAGGTNCAGHAISLGTNAGNKDADTAMARVMVAFNGSADLPTMNVNRTIEFWAYVPTTAWAADGNTMFFYGTNNRNNDGYGLDFGTTSGGIGTIDPFTNNSTTDPMGDNKPSGLMANMAQWAHFAMTWDGTSVHAYVNGVEKVSVAIPAMLHTGATALTIGGYAPAFFNGYIDEFRIWNVAHSAAEITATMNKTLVGNEAGLVGYWKFDETIGTTAADSVTTAGHTAHPGTLMANTTANLPTWIVSTAPISCP